MIMCAKQSPTLYRCLLIAVLLLCVAAIAVAPSASLAQTQSPEQVAAPIDPVSPPLRLDLREDACAAAEVVGREDPHYFAERDLCAQFQAVEEARNSARWAAIQGLLSVLTLAILAWTLFLTSQSARAAADSARAATASNDQAREFYAADRRPWLSVAVESVGVISNLQLIVRLEIKNVGRSVASHFNVIVPNDTWLRPAPEWGARNLKELKRHIEAEHASPTTIGMTLFPDQTHLESVSVPHSGFETQFLGGYVVYHSVAANGTTSVHTTPFILAIQSTMTSAQVVDASAEHFIHTIIPT